MRKKSQKLTVYVIVALLVISLVGSSFVMFFGDTGNTNAPVTGTYESQIASLNKALEANPQDSQTRLNLANIYYDWALQTQSGNTPEKAGVIFQQAVAEYQEVIKSNKNVNVLVDMATAAFYGGQDDLAEQTFKEALELDPKFLNGLFNYGIFLMYAKEDFGAAIAQWEKALTIENLSEENKQRLQSSIKLAQDKIVENFEKTGSVDPSESTSGAK
ncbi:MAG: tetratricopeptide repeat protein [Desulfitobacterium sp.]